jgi:uncharacterized protein (DUF2062 family)
MSLGNSRMRNISKLTQLTFTIKPETRANIMAKKLIQKYLPDLEKIRQHKNLQFLGERLHLPHLWLLNRHQISAAFAIGLFCAWIPTPGQMAIAGIAAFYFEANLPISVALVWLTNPLTMPPLFYFAYRVGLAFLDYPPPDTDFEFSLSSLLTGVGDIGGIFLYGCFVCGVISAVLGYLGVQLFWRYHVAKQWADRHKTRHLSSL